MKIYYICVVATLIMACAVSFVITMLSGSKGAKIIFCIFSALCLAVSVVLWLIAFKIIFIELFAPIADELYFEALAIGLTIISSAELGGLLCKKINSNPISSKSLKPKVESEDYQEYSISERKKDKRLHGEYTVIKE